jgi:hypothetical protein
VNGICGFGSPAHCCQPAVAGGVIYADLRGGLSTHLVPKALFAQSSARKPLLQAFPFPSTLGKVTLHPCSQACMLFTVHVGGGSSHLSCGVFLPPPLSQAFLLLVAGRAPLLPPESLQPARLVYLQFWEGFPSPNLWCSVCPTLFPACLYCSSCLLLVSLISPGGGQSVQGAMLLWPRLVCGSTAIS